MHELNRKVVVPRLNEGIKGGEERVHDRLELGVGDGEGGLEVVDVGEERLELVVDEDEVLVVCLADLFDLGLFGTRRVAKRDNRVKGVALWWITIFCCMNAPTNTALPHHPYMMHHK